MTARRWACADSINLKAVARPAAREPGPLVTLVRCRAVAKVSPRAERLPGHPLHPRRGTDQVRVIRARRADGQPLHPQEQPLGQEQLDPCPHEQLRIMPRSCDAAVVAARHTMVTPAFVSFTEARGRRPCPLCIREQKS